jgi:regulator of replication initiation timing
MIKILSILLLCGCILDVRAADTTTDYSKQIEKLQAENAKLKEEIQNLRKLLGSSPTQASPVVNTSTTTQTADKPAIQPSGDVKTTGFWLTSSSKKRHNSSCRYYKTSNGSECGANDGTPCKLCGG